MQAPWTEIGRLQSEVSDINRQLNGKVESYEVHAIRSNVDSLERSFRSLSSDFDELRFRVETSENNISLLEEQELMQDD